MGCEHWHRRMYAKFRASGKSHVTCGRPWAEHGEMGECPKKKPADQTGG